MDEQSIFALALEKKPSGERDAFLDKVCAANAQLRTALEALLHAHEQPDSFLEAPGGNLLHTIDEPAIRERPGTLIGPYKLLELIGEGGMGLVFVAEQQMPVRRRVALKIIKPGMDSRQVIARFEAERQALALMDHPNIAKVHDGGTIGGEPGRVSAGRPYFVMELVKGKPITEYCDRNQLRTRQRLELFLDVCHAVQHAHQKGIIHRDLKPSNILVEVHDVRPVVKIIDFGIAKAIDQQLSDKTMYTGIAQMIGTPMYMSPEQAGLSSLDVDTRSDVYALGVLLYELLTGTTPFDSEILKKAGYDEMRRIIREDEPAKPSARLSTLHQEALSTIAEQRGMEPRKLGQQMRGELDWIVMKALEKDRNRRYESASAFGADVQRYLQDEPVLACPPSKFYRLGKFLRRHRTGVFTAAVLFGAAMVLGAVFGKMALDQESQRAAIELAVKEDLQDASRALREDQLADAIQALERGKLRLEGSGLDSLQNQVTERRREVALVAQIMEARLKASEVTSDGKRNYAGAAQAYEAAFAAYGLDIATHNAEEFAAKLKGSVIQTPVVIGLDFWAFAKERLPKGDGEQLRVIARLADDDAWRRQLRDPKVIKSRESLKRLAEENGILTQPAANLWILSVLLDKANAPAAGVKLLRRAQKRYPADFWLNYELGNRLFSNPATVAEAVGFLRVAVALQPKSPVAYLNLGYAFGKQGNWTEAEDADRKAIEIKPDYAAAHYNLGCDLDEQRRLPEAEQAYRKAIQLNPNFTYAYVNLGKTLSDQQNLAEAEKPYRKTVELSPTFALAYYLLGLNLSKQQQLPEAEKFLRQAIEIQADYAEAYNELGVTLANQKRFQEAEEAFRKCIDLKPDYAQAYPNLGHCLCDQQKNYPEAEAAYRKAIALNPSAGNYSDLGCCLTDQKKFIDAEKATRKAIQINSNFALAYNNLGFILAKQQKFSEAVAMVRKAVDLDDHFKYDAASIVALAGCDQDDAAAELDAKERAQIRGQALVWLRACLASTRKKLEKEPEKAGSDVQRKMKHWLEDPDFACIRGDEALSRLPEAERREWQKLWEEVADLENRAGEER